MTKYVFNEVKVSKKVKKPCTACGKVAQRTFTAMQTINPFNRNAAGVPKTSVEIGKEIHTELEVLLAQPFVCKSCEDAQDP